MKNWVIDFYNNGGGQGLHIELENQSLPFDNLGLSKNEKADIISFLKTLTDTSMFKFNHNVMYQGVHR